MGMARNFSTENKLFEYKWLVIAPEPGTEFEHSLRAFWGFSAGKGKRIAENFYDFAVNRKLKIDIIQRVKFLGCSV